MEPICSSECADMQEEHQDTAAHVLSPKRKRVETASTSAEPEPKEKNKHRSFVRIEDHKGVFCSDNWKPDGGTLYRPLCGPVLANLHKYDQISFESGLFCLTDKDGRFLQRVQGPTLNCWKFNKLKNKLFIVVSYFFTDDIVYQDVLKSIDYL